MVFATSYGSSSVFLECIQESINGLEWPVVVLIFMIFCAIRQSKQSKSNTKLICTNGSNMEDLITRFPSYRMGYKPTSWCFSPMLMTVIPYLMQRDIEPNYEREVLRTPDGGQFAIHWDNRHQATRKQLVIILPGMDGKRNKITNHLLNVAKELGCITAVISYRGTEINLLTPRFYTISNCDDLDLAVKHIKSKYPSHALFAVGYSYGGMNLSIYLAKHSTQCLISNAFVISASFNMKNSFEKFNKFQYKVLDVYLVNNLLSRVKREKHLFENDKRFDMKRVFKSKSIYELDKYFISKQFSYATIDKYYEDSSIDSKIADIRVPTLFLNASDDLFCPRTDIPLDRFRANKSIALILTSHGGHCIFGEGFIPTGCHFTCRLFRDYLSSVL